jgi:cytochrome c oxidase subunit 3
MCVTPCSCRKWAGSFDAEKAAHFLQEHGVTHIGPDGHVEMTAHPAAASHGGDHASKDEFVGDAGHDAAAHPDAHLKLPQKLGIFFSIYFFLTGLHGLHIIGGIIALSWLLRRAIRGDFGPTYFGPVDYVGLYWHLVDLIWIYLFPLLYLIQS